LQWGCVKFCGRSYRDASRVYDAVGNVIAVINACVLQSASKQQRGRFIPEIKGERKPLVSRLAQWNGDKFDHFYKILGAFAIQFT